MAITKEQIIALIDAKIAGQGSAVDIGGALPAILKGLADMGISSDMSETEQMQARKDLGLYYEETTTGEKTAKYTDETESVTLPGYAKISDDTPAKEDLISIGNLNDLEYLDLDDGYKVGPRESSMEPDYYIVLDNSIGHEPGIYYNLEFQSYNFPLTYIGEVEVVSKVPDKFLPVAWNQLVTEGTKIAEVTIGDETTDVFAPEGGGALETVALLQIPAADQYGITITDYMSLDDFQKVVNLESIVAVFDSKQTFLITVKKSTDMMGNVSSYVYFIGENGAAFYIYYDGISTYSITVIDNSPNIEITQLPTASMTSQELAAIGITGNAMSGVIDGKKTGFTLPYGDGLFPVLSADFVNGYQLVVEFWSSSNKYVITMDMTMYAASCTVTPR